MIRVIVHQDGTSNQNVRFRAATEAGSLLCSSDQPMVDAARILIGQGADPATPATMRHAGKGYDSFAPMPLGDWAKVTYSERVNGRLTKERWKPRQDAVSRDAGWAKVASGDLSSTHIAKIDE